MVIEKTENYYNRETIFTGQLLKLLLRKFPKILITMGVVISEFIHNLKSKSYEKNIIKHVRYFIGAGY